MSPSCKPGDIQKDNFCIIVVFLQLEVIWPLDRGADSKLISELLNMEYSTCIFCALMERLSCPALLKSFRSERAMASITSTDSNNIRIRCDTTPNLPGRQILYLYMYALFNKKFEISLKYILYVTKNCKQNSKVIFCL